MKRKIKSDSQQVTFFRNLLRLFFYCEDKVIQSVLKAVHTKSKNAKITSGLGQAKIINKNNYLNPKLSVLTKRK